MNTTTTEHDDDCGDSNDCGCDTLCDCGAPYVEVEVPQGWRNDERVRDVLRTLIGQWDHAEYTNGSTSWSFYFDGDVHAKALYARDALWSHGVNGVEIRKCRR